MCNNVNAIQFRDTHGQIEISVWSHLVLGPSFHGGSAGTVPDVELAWKSYKLCRGVCPAA